MSKGQKNIPYIHTVFWLLFLAAFLGGIWYLFETLLPAIPFIVLMWLREEFFVILKEHAGRIAVSAILFMLVVGTALAIFGAFRLGMTAGLFLTGVLMSSYAALGGYYEKRGIDIVVRELRGVKRSFRDAFAGFGALGKERNLTFHTAAASAVVVAGILASLSVLEWALLSIAMALVISSELLNFAIERHVDAVVKYHDGNAKRIKDAAAAAVLIAAITALIIGGIVFIPHILGAL